MKKKLIGLLSMALIVCMGVHIVGVYATPRSTGQTDLSKLHVRVNGYEVDFTDAQPYIDENNRTMIPLRAAVEALGAEVIWDQDTYTASITKNGITVKVTIGSKEIIVVNEGVVDYMTMDTMAVLNAEEGRTYVPIRYVAEALGAYVDYSSAFRTIGIYQDVLTPEEIDTLHAYELGYGNHSSTYEIWVEKYGKEDADWIYPYHYVRQESFASAREALYDSLTDATPTNCWGDAIGQQITEDDRDEYFILLAKEAVAELTYVAEHEVMYQRMRMEFRADASSIYVTTTGGATHLIIRGYLLYYQNLRDTSVNCDKYGIDYDGIHKADNEQISKMCNHLKKMVAIGKRDLEDLKWEDRYIHLDIGSVSADDGKTLLVPVDVVIQIDQYAPAEYQVYTLSMTALDNPIYLEGPHDWEDFQS